MFKSYFKIAIRNLRKKKVHSFINITGLSVGMAVAMLIGLWIYDEASFNKYHDNYSQIARVMQHTSVNGQVFSSVAQPVPLSQALKQKYGTNFKHVVISSYTQEEIISFGEQFIYESGNYMEADAPQMLSLKMVKGIQNGLNDLNAIMISKSLSDRLFGREDPINKIVTINKQTAVKVTGVYEDLPSSSDFYNVAFIAPWKLYVASNEWMKQFLDKWEYDVALLYVQVQNKSNIETISNKIENIINDHTKEDKNGNLSGISLHPMSKWHLYEEFKDGINTGGRIQFVWLFGIIGISVLLLACINFMNLSTARSERRTREVGIRKAIGSLRSQLMFQFYSESFLVVMIAFIVSLSLVYSGLSWFNMVTDKNMVIPWVNPYFWFFSLAFMLVTGIMAGSYPAIYLSSFEVIKALKGTFHVGRMAALPRYVLVVVQFTVSVMLIIGTIIVYRQIQFSKGRPAGYDQSRLISVNMGTGEIHGQFDVIRNKLISNGTIIDMAEASLPAGTYGVNLTGFDWRGKDPGFSDNFGAIWVSPEYGKTIGWQITGGRDFSRHRTGDRSGIIINRSAAEYMGLKKPVGEIVSYKGTNFTIIGVVNDMVVESPYQSIRPSIYMLSPDVSNAVIFKLNPLLNTRAALDQIQVVFTKYAPGIPFNYQFADQQYAIKFNAEIKIGKLSSIFAALAIFISCLGLFGLASFVAEQRTKEIGVRKVLGASFINLWGLLSKEFVMLVVISFLIATPITWYFMHNWLQNYQYRTAVTWWIFAAAGIGALLITLLTVSFQSIKAALANPVKSLRTD